jgi:hypothetical protein
MSDADKTLQQIEHHRTTGARGIVVTFSSYLNPGRTEPSYAFMKTVLGVKSLTETPFDVAYLLANGNDWYLSGVRGMGSDLEESIAQLRDFIAPYDWTVFVGNSMGGYAALAFGWVAQASRILAISPQTRLDKAFLDGIGDHRWVEGRGGMWSRTDLDRFALQVLFQSAGPYTGLATVVVGAGDARDVAHVNQIREFPHVEIREAVSGGHDLVHVLRDNGELASLVAFEVDRAAALSGREAQ